MAHTTYNAVEAAAGAYGPTWRRGVATDHLYLVIDAGAVVHISPSGRTYVQEGRECLPVLCGEVIEIATEDGPMSGRCGEYVYDNDLACPGHAAQIWAWRGESEYERFLAEQRAERAGR